MEHVESEFVGLPLIVSTGSYRFLKGANLPKLWEPSRVPRDMMGKWGSILPWYQPVAELLHIPVVLKDLKVLRMPCCQRKVLLHKACFSVEVLV